MLAGVTTDKLNLYIKKALLCPYLYSFMWADKDYQKKEINFPAGGAELVLLWKKTFQ